MTTVTTLVNDPVAYNAWHDPDAPKAKLQIDDFSLSAWSDHISVQTNDDVAIGDIEIDSLSFTRESLPRLRAFINNPLIDSLFDAAKSR